MIMWWLCWARSVRAPSASAGPTPARVASSGPTTTRVRRWNWGRASACRHGSCGGAEPLLNTLTAYFHAGNATAAARALHLSVRALTYRLERIHRLTGYDPTAPEQRYTLETAMLGARLLGWPQQQAHSAGPR